MTPEPVLRTATTTPRHSPATRLEIVREMFRSSDTTTVHMKDRVSGKQTFLPFARSVLRGLDDYQI